MDRQGMIYREQWPAHAKLYAGAQGTMPTVGEMVLVENALDGIQVRGIVKEVNARTYEYTVIFAGQMRQMSLGL